MIPSKYPSLNYLEPIPALDYLENDNETKADAVKLEFSELLTPTAFCSEPQLSYFYTSDIFSTIIILSHPH